MSWSQKLGAAVSQNPMLHHSFPTLGCTWMLWGTTAPGPSHSRTPSWACRRLQSRSPHFFLQKLCDIGICRKWLNPKQDQECVSTWFSLGPWMASVKTMLEMVYIWSFPAQRVGETYQDFLPRPMNFSQYIDSKSDFWLQKWCQSVSCDHPIFGLHHVFSPFATSYPTQRAASLPAFLALRWSKGSRPLLSMAPPSPSAYSCASCTTFGQQKVSFPLRQQSTGNLCTSSGG